MEAVGIATDTDALLEPAGRTRRRRQGGRAGRARSWSAASSTSARPSSCRRSCSTSSSCPRPSASRPATPPTPTRWPTCTSRPSTRCWSCCCATARSPGSRSVVDGLLPLIDDHGRIHTTFNQTVAATGRLSSIDPNLQNIPVRTAEGRRIREAFIVGAGFETLMTADYSQIEMRIMAHLSRDAGLIEAFTTGEDLHTFVASRAFDLPAGTDRRRAAATGQGDVLRPGLRAVRLRPVQAAQDHAGRGARADGRVLHPVRRRARLPALGRRRRPPDRLHRDDHGPAPVPGQAQQRQPQPARDGRTGRAERADPGQRGRHHQGRDARACTAGWPRQGLRSRLLLQVHDELVLEVAAGRARRGRGAGAARDGRRLPARRPARRLGRASGAPGTRPRTDPAPQPRGERLSRYPGTKLPAPRDQGSSHT